MQEQVSDFDTSSHCTNNASQSWPRVLLARGLIYWRVLSIVTSFLVIAWFVLAVEFSLRWNSVTGIYDIGSTGQLIPFIIGLLGLLRVIHVTIRSTDEDVRPPSEIDSAWVTNRA